MNRWKGGGGCRHKARPASRSEPGLRPPYLGLPIASLKIDSFLETQHVTNRRQLDNRINQQVTTGTWSYSRRQCGLPQEGAHIVGTDTWEMPRGGRQRPAQPTPSHQHCLLCTGLYSGQPPLPASFRAEVFVCKAGASVCSAWFDVFISVLLKCLLTLPKIFPSAPH